MGIAEDLLQAGMRQARGWMTESEDDVSYDDMSKAMSGAGVGTGSPVPTEEKPRGLYHDPYSTMDWGGWRQRPSAMTYETLRNMATQNTVVGAIIQIRTHQVAQFARPQQGTYDKGYRVILRDRRDANRQMTDTEQKQATEIETMLETTGMLLDNERPSDRDSFGDFLKKGVRDILIYDQWCASAGHQVLMSDGSYTAIEDVAVGDWVQTHEGRSRRVTETFSRSYTGPMYRIRYRGRELEVTEGHPLLVEQEPHLKNRNKCADKSYRPDWVEASAVKTGQYLVCPDFVLPEEDFATPYGTADTAMARVMGLYAGDGHNNKGTATWTFHEDEADLVDAVRDVFPSAVVVPYENRRAVSVRVRGAGDWLEETLGKGSANKCVPQIILKSLQSLKRAFLRGYIEADGHIRNGSTAVLSTTSERLQAGTTLLAGSLGMFVSWSDTANERHGWSSCKQGRLSGDAFIAFAASSGLRGVQAPGRVRNATVHAEGNHYLRINEASSFDACDHMVYNFEVDEDHSYILNGIASHNCWEKMRDRTGKVSRFIALPSETIRPAVADVEHMDPADLRDRVSHVQVYDNTIIAEFGVDDMAWCVMNPRSDLRVNGFGYSPLEQMLRLVSSWLYGFEYNSRFFTQGSAIKGVLNIKGAIPDRQMRAFRRMWYGMITGLTGSWKTPILNSEDIQWVSMHSSNRDMEFNEWMSWLTKLTCAIYGIDPVEIGFVFGDSSGGGSMFSSRPNAQEVIESKDKGLVPLTQFIADKVNSHIVWDMYPEFEFSFTGMDAKAENKERERRQLEVKAWKTVDEVRAEVDMDPLPEGKGLVILDPTWLQNAQGGEEGGEDGDEDLGPGEDDGSEAAFGDDDDDDSFDDDGENGPPDDMGDGDDAGDFDKSRADLLLVTHKVSGLVDELRKSHYEHTVEGSTQRIIISRGS